MKLKRVRNIVMDFVRSIVESEFKKNNNFLMTVCMMCDKMISMADIMVKNGVYSIKEIRDDISKIKIESDEQMCIDCYKKKKQGGV